MFIKKMLMKIYINIVCSRFGKLWLWVQRDGYSVSGLRLKLVDWSKFNGGIEV